jgi:hypothetical protein
MDNTMIQVSADQFIGLMVGYDMEPLTGGDALSMAVMSKDDPKMMLARMRTIKGRHAYEVNAEYLRYLLDTHRDDPITDDDIIMLIERNIYQMSEEKHVYAEFHYALDDRSRRMWKALSRNLVTANRSLGALMRKGGAK